MAGQPCWKRAFDGRNLVGARTVEIIQAYDLTDLQIREVDLMVDSELLS
jgi:hypothetical protein